MQSACKCRDIAVTPDASSVPEVPFVESLPGDVVIWRRHARDARQHLCLVCKPEHARRSGDMDGEADAESSRVGGRIHRRATKRHRGRFQGRRFSYQSGQCRRPANLDRRGSGRTLSRAAWPLLATVAVVDQRPSVKGRRPRAARETQHRRSDRRSAFTGYRCRPSNDMSRDTAARGLNL